MGRRTIAPRLRLLGLLLICASIIMGLLLSAIGVQSVTLSSPLAQGIAEKIQNVSNTPTGSPSNNHTLPGNFQHGAVSGGHSPISENGSQGHEQNKPLTISLWALVGPICLVGILLWMTPMPAPAPTSNRSYKRR